MNTNGAWCAWCIVHGAWETLLFAEQKFSLFLKSIRVRLSKIERRLYFMRVSWPLLQFAVCAKSFCSERERRSSDELLSTGEGWLKDGPEIDEVVCKLFSPPQLKSRW